MGATGITGRACRAHGALLHGIAVAHVAPMRRSYSQQASQKG
jgi:hypothetical protein